MKERECWEALRAFINDAPTEDIDGEGWYEPEEVAEGRYKFKSDSTAGKESVAVKDIDTSQVRSIRRDSINPYWGRAKESGTASSSVS
jgi:hypothetical protein